MEPPLQQCHVLTDSYRYYDIQHRSPKNVSDVNFPTILQMELTQGQSKHAKSPIKLLLRYEFMTRCGVPQHLPRVQHQSIY